MRVSQAGINLIKEFEGFVGHPYQDMVGVWTIGYGHTEGVTRRSPHISEHQASQLLERDLNSKYAAAVNRLGVALNQNEFDALVCFVYNLGTGIIGPDHTIGKDLRKPKAGHGVWRNQVADDILLYDHAGSHRVPGLTRRRQAERELFLKSMPKKPTKKGAR
jgi:lysozyme